MNENDWYAWINTMPPKPDDFHVVGHVEIPNPGVEAMLSRRQRQSLSGEKIELELRFHQRPGMWPQVLSFIQARYDEVLSPITPHYKKAEIYQDGALTLSLDVEEIR